MGRVVVFFKQKTAYGMRFSDWSSDVRSSELLDLTGAAQGVQIFIGAENELFGLAGCSMIIAPYCNSQQKVVGAIGVIGPTRIDYARIIPMIDYTAKVLGRLVG